MVLKAKVLALGPIIFKKEYGRRLRLVYKVVLVGTYKHSRW